MKKILLPVFLLGTMVMMFIMAQTSALLKTPASPAGIVSLEFAYDTATTNAIINAWAPTATTNKIAAAKINTYTDFLFLFFYAGFLHLACKAIAVKLKGGFSRAGHIIANATLFAGLADVMENTGILFSLNHLISSTVSFCTVFFSVIKWSIVFIAVLYLLTSLLALAFCKKRVEPQRY